jgi:hypothetical protein
MQPLFDKPSSEFFETLGEYVYEYINDDGEQLYIGKGIGDRCLHHLKSKKFKLQHCYIIACNLEKFETPAYCLESYLIATKNPERNSVSGHHKECFVMTSLSSMFSDFQAGKVDNFEEFPEWYTEHYDALRGKLRTLQINDSNYYIVSNANRGIYFTFYWYPAEESVKVTFEFASYFKGEDLEEIKNKITMWLSTENGYEVEPAGKTDYKLAVTCKNINDVMVLFRKFFS